jgi:NAD(P)-dependent dehydrogenase (short-subunit alcohol dehydrogenase family)
MIQQKSGVIINIGSSVRVKNFASMSIYNASKAAINSLTLTVAKELAGYGTYPSLHPFSIPYCIGIRVLQIDLGPFDTDFMRQSPKEVLDGIPSITLAGRMGKVEEAVPSILFLASKDASYITGTSLFVDGGVTAL